MRNRWLGAGAAAVAVAAVAAVAVAAPAQDRGGLDGVAVGDVPVWYDADGLHRGDAVERTPVEVGVVSGDTMMGALALVRSGAVYADPATGDVWFHPWGGDPRIVGHGSEAGPGGDPNGHTAVWFEGSDALNTGPGELVVYNTAAGREISRTRQARGVNDCSGVCGDHYPAGNGFLQVSARRVVWTSGSRTYSHDVRTRRTSVFKTLQKRYLVDVHDLVKLLGERNPWVPVLKVPGRAEQRYPDLETHARLSPGGGYLLAVEGTEERHGAAIVDTRTGKLWRVPRDAYPWIAWSYGNIAMVDTDDELLACDAARRTCERLRAKRPFLMPTN